MSINEKVAEAASFGVHFLGLLALSLAVVGGIVYLTPEVRPQLPYLIGIAAAYSGAKTLAATLS